MKVESIIEKARKSRYVKLSESELENLLSASQILQDKETNISDTIRLLKFNGELLIQEKTDKDEFIVRLMKTKEEAEELELD